MSRQIGRCALAHVVAVLVLAALPAVASAWTVTVHVHGAGAVDETTARNLMNCEVPPGGKAESTVTDCVAGTPGGLYNSFDIINLQQVVPQAAYDRGWRFLKWVDGNAPGQVNCDPQDTLGDHTANTCQFQIFENLYVDLYFDDIAGPTGTAISNGPSGTTKVSSASFEFDASGDPDASFDCKLDRPGVPGGYVACGGPLDKSEGYGGLTTNGSYTFTVRAKDPTGNIGAIDTRTWTVDTVAPSLSLGGGPAQGSTTNQAGATFNIAIGDGSVSCTLDGAPRGCAPGNVVLSSLADGPHTFSVSATDAAGNTNSASRTWTVDTTAPDAAIAGTPAEGATVTATTAEFSLSATGGAVSFECSLDGGAFAACVDPATYSLLGEGPHSFEARAIDLAGNTGPAATWSWTVVPPPPDPPGPPSTVVPVAAAAAEPVVQQVTAEGRLFVGLKVILGWRTLESVHGARVVVLVSQPARVRLVLADRRGRTLVAREWTLHAGRSVVTLPLPHGRRTWAGATIRAIAITATQRATAKTRLELGGF
jgi:hypothetical protein